MTLPRVNPCLPCVVAGNPGMRTYPVTVGSANPDRTEYGTFYDDEADLKSDGYASSGERSEIDWANFEHGPNEGATVWTKAGAPDMLVGIETGSVVGRAEFEKKRGRNPRKKSLPCSTTHVDMPYSHAHFDLPGAHAATAPGAKTIEYAPHGEVGQNPRKKRDHKVHIRKGWPVGEDRYGAVFMSYCGKSVGEQQSVSDLGSSVSCAECVLAQRQARGGNPLTPGERRKLRGSIETLESLGTAGDCATKGYIGGLKRCERQFNPAMVGDKIRVRGQTGLFEVLGRDGRLVHLRADSGAEMWAPEWMCMEPTPHTKRWGNPPRWGHSPSEPALRVGEIVGVRGTGRAWVVIDNKSPATITLRPQSGGPAQTFSRDDVRPPSKDNPKAAALTVGDVVKLVGDSRVFEVALEPQGGEVLLMRLGGTVGRSGMKQVSVDDVQLVSRGNPRRKALWGVWSKPGGCAKVRRVGDPDEAKLVRQGFKLVTTDASHELADRTADELYGGRVGNPKLVVLNPANPGHLAEVARKRLGRALKAEELKQLAHACREFKTFFGRDPRPEDVVPVDAPPGTPLFVNMVGRLDRVDYTVPSIGSHRDGRWTHKAGDHGRSRSTRPPFLASIPGRKDHNYTIVEPKGSRTYFKPTHGLMG